MLSVLGVVSMVWACGYTLKADDTYHKGSRVTMKHYVMNYILKLILYNHQNLSDIRPPLDRQSKKGLMTSVKPLKHNQSKVYFNVPWSTV